jgi:hypothetical protein
VKAAILTAIDYRRINCNCGAGGDSIRSDYGQGVVESPAVVVVVVVVVLLVVVSLVVLLVDESTALAGAKSTTLV